VDSSKFWELIKQEPDILNNSYANYKDVFDLAILAWDNFITPTYFTDFKHMSTPLSIYKTQADVAFKQAITSVMMREYSQAIYNIRLGVENIVIAIYCYAQPEAALEFFKPEGSMDRKIRAAANKYLATTLPERSDRLKGLHKTCDEYGSHQSFSHAGRNFGFDEDNNSFNIMLIGEDSPHLAVGLTGITVGTMIEFYFAITGLGGVDWIKVAPSTENTFRKILKDFEAIKIKYKHLWANLA